MYPKVAYRQVGVSPLAEEEGIWHLDMQRDPLYQCLLMVASPFLLTMCLGEHFHRSHGSSFAISTIGFYKHPG